MRVAASCLTVAALPTLLALAACQPAPENGVEEQPSPENIAEVEGTPSGDVDTSPAAQTPPVESADALVALPASDARVTTSAPKTNGASLNASDVAVGVAIATVPSRTPSTKMANRPARAQKVARTA